VQVSDPGEKSSHSGDKMLENNLTLVAILFATSLCAAVPVQVGTWKFNPEKSQLPPSDAAVLKGEIVTIESAGENAMRLTRENPATGKKTVSTGVWDGKEHPNESEPGVTSISTRLDDRHSRRVFKKDGKVKQTLEISHSVDGKTRTVTRKGIRTNGKEIPQPWIEVYDRQ
jgi:hypothetical protein